MYCNRSYLWVCVWEFVCLWVCLWVCYHDNSNLLQLIKFWPSRALGKGFAAGRNFLAPPYYSQRGVFAFSLSAFFILTCERHCRAAASQCESKIRDISLRLFLSQELQRIREAAHRCSPETQSRQPCSRRTECEI